MPQPIEYRLTIASRTPNVPFEDAIEIVSFEFEAFPTASCTLAQHYAAKAWYELQARLEPKEPTS